HSTWMDARVNGIAVTPRMGRLPEINALWFQARCLHALWLTENRAGADPALLSQLEALGKQALECKEPHRPNTIFLHSLPLSPSFVMREQEALGADLAGIAERFWTPVGLRTLDASDPHFHAHCVGNQDQRDFSYHQGPAWAWLGGHYLMARARLAPAE